MLTLNIIVSTNQSDTINYLLYSEKAGSKMDNNNNFKYNVFAGDYDSNKIDYMKYKYSYFYLTFYDIPNQTFSDRKEFDENKISKIVANSVNTYHTSNLLSAILINNLNSIEIDNTLLDYSNIESSIYNDYNSIDQLNIIYMLCHVKKNVQEFVEMYITDDSYLNHFRRYIRLLPFSRSSL